jgi:hypothetical protein
MSFQPFSDTPRGAGTGRRRLPPWAVLVTLVALCAAIIAGIALVRSREVSTSALLERLPSDNAVIVAIDFRALRRGGVLGVLTGSKMAQEAEYRAFVDETGFDYLRDLDAAVISFHSTGTYFLLRGRFDWKTLKDYTLHQGGTCHNAMCTANGSTPERKISYFPFRTGVMALAVSTDGYAASALQKRRAFPKIDIPSEPVWALIPISALKNSGNLPAGAKAFVRILDGADTVVLAAGPQGQGVLLRLDATCGTPARAARLTTELQDITARLRDLIAREHQTPNPRDLSSVFAAGAFEQRDVHVLGRWLVGRELLESLAGGAL